MKTFFSSSATKEGGGDFLKSHLIVKAQFEAIKSSYFELLQIV